MDKDTVSLTQLRETFRAYTDTVQVKLQKEAQKVAKDLPDLFPDKSSQLRQWVRVLESQPVFDQLVRETRSVFYGDFHKGSESWWQDAVMNFFRRSGYYSDTFEGMPVSANEMFDLYVGAFRRQKKQITYLALMEWIRFWEDVMNFGTFQVQKFGLDELRSVLQNRVNEVFYEFSGLDPKQLIELLDYWFVCVKQESVPVLPLGSIQVPFGVPTDYTDYPRTVEASLAPLALFDFDVGEQANREYDWRRFTIPWVFRVDDNLLGVPASTSDFPALERAFVPDPVTGKDTGMTEPLLGIYLDDEETERFKACVRTVDGLLSALTPFRDEWGFLEVALGFFLRAFFSEGRDQLLWHMVVLDALLLGEREREGLTQKLAGRTAAILGKSEGQKKALRKRFNRLYDLRSQLVHGRTPKDRGQVNPGDLADARDLARRALLWFLHCFGRIEVGLRHCQRTEKIPTHEDLLALLDIGKEGRKRVQWLIGELPQGFPYVTKWGE